MRRLAALSVVALGMAIAIPAWAQRIVLPIAEHVVKDGVRRYTITVTVEGRSVEAALDTGSTGLRIVAAAFPGPDDAMAKAVSYAYGSGVRTEGVATPLIVGFAPLAGRAVPVMRIDQATCRPERPDCAANDARGADYRIMSDGKLGQGFAAVIGLGVRANVVPNRLIAIGIRQWIVDLPRASDDTSGTLILNPDDAEIARYRRIAFIGQSDQVAGCLSSADGKKRICEAAIDTGANGNRLKGGTRDQILEPGAAAIIGAGDDRTTLTTTLTMPIKIGKYAQAGRLRVAPAIGERLPRTIVRDRALSALVGIVRCADAAPGRGGSLIFLHEVTRCSI